MGSAQQRQSSENDDNYNFVKPEDKTFVTTEVSNDGGLKSSQIGITAIQDVIKEEEVEQTPMNKGPQPEGGENPVGSAMQKEENIRASQASVLERNSCLEQEQEGDGTFEKVAQAAEVNLAEEGPNE